MSKHTKGPWIVSKDKRFISCLVGDIKTDKYGEYISGTIAAQTYGITIEEGEANAQLIAAAPEMLEALELLLKKYNYVHEIHFGVLSPRDDSFVTYIENILKKAKGEL